jgi:hypothetical protein
LPEAIIWTLFNVLLNGLVEMVNSFFKELGAKLFSVAFRKWKKNRNKHEFVRPTEQ